MYQNYVHVLSVRSYDQYQTVISFVKKYIYSREQQRRGTMSIRRIQFVVYI